MKTGIMIFWSVWVSAFFFTLNTGAQSLDRHLIGSSGGSASAGDVSLSWSAGEAVTGTIGTSSYTLDQGFQQGYMDEDPNILIFESENGIEIHAFPNPVSEYLNISWDGVTLSEQVLLTVTDLSGRTMMQYNVNGDIQGTRLPVNNLAHGSYILRVTIDGLESYTFRFVRN